MWLNALWLWLSVAECTLAVTARVAEICDIRRAIAAGADIHLIDDREGEEREHCPALVLAACGCYPGVISVLLDAVRPPLSALCSLSPPPIYCAALKTSGVTQTAARCHHPGVSTLRGRGSPCLTTAVD